MSHDNEAPETGVSARTGRRELLGLTHEELTAVLSPYIERRFRVDQIDRALHERGVEEIAAITELPLEMRSRLEESFVVGQPRIVESQTSEDDTVKVLFELGDGSTIEAVDIPEDKRRTFCISSQAGCALGCAFCVTGYWGAGRNLTRGEIVGQVLALRRMRPDDPRGVNLVLMGMGEPLLNADNVRGALERLAQSISWQRMTLSTAGVVPGIEALARWPRRPNLAVSIHAPDEERRNQLMPINRSYPLAALIPALRRFPLERGRRITIEYLLIDGFNDSLADADQLVRLLGGVKGKINLIPLNPDPVLGASLAPPPPERVEAFRERLRAKGWLATVRRRRGDRVSAACGQLRAANRPPRGFRRSNLSF